MLHLKYPNGRPVGSATRWIDDIQSREKWGNRQNIIFNRDHERAALQAKDHNSKRVREDGAFEEGEADKWLNFWREQAREMQGTSPLYEKHTQELQNRLSNKAIWHMTRGNKLRTHKWNSRLGIIKNGDVESAKAMERDYHIKAIKAGQYKDEWGDQFEYEDDVPRGALPLLESYRTPHKELLHSSLSDHIDPRVHSSVDSTLVVRRQDASENDDSDAETYLPMEDSPSAIQNYKKIKSKGPPTLREYNYAASRRRIREKVKSNHSTRAKWKNRLMSLRKGDHQHAFLHDQIKYYHNKGIDMKWNQLRWASAAHYLAQQKNSQSEAGHVGPSTSSTVPRQSSVAKKSRLRRLHEVPKQEVA